MIKSINDHIQLDCNGIVDYKLATDATGNKIVCGWKEAVVEEQEANSTNEDPIPSYEKPLDTLHRRSGGGWKYLAISNSPRAEIMVKGGSADLGGSVMKQYGMALCVESGPRSILQVYLPVGTMFDEHEDACKLMLEAAKALIINGKRLSLLKTNLGEISRALIPEYRPGDGLADLVPVIQADEPVSVNLDLSDLLKLLNL